MKLYIICAIIFVVLWGVAKLFSEDNKVSKVTRIVLFVISLAITFGISSCDNALEKRGRINDLYNQAESAYENGSYIEAEEYLNEVLSLNSNHKKANELMSDVKPLAKQENITKLLSNIKVLRDEGNYIDAYETAKQVLELDPTNTEADTLRQELLEPANQQRADEEAAEAERKAAKEAEEAERKAAEEKEKAEKEAQEKAAAEKAEAERKAAEQAQKQSTEQRAKELAEQSRQNAENIKKKYIANCVGVTSYDLLRTPNAYKNKPVNVSGTVSSQVNLQKGRLQSILESAGITESSDYEMVEIEDGYGEIAIIYSPSVVGRRFLNGDYINIYGDSLGLTELTLTNIYGTTSSYKIPEVRANFVN